LGAKALGESMGRGTRRPARARLAPIGFAVLGLISCASADDEPQKVVITPPRTEATGVPAVLNPVPATGNLSGSPATAAAPTADISATPISIDAPPRTEILEPGREQEDKAKIQYFEGTGHFVDRKAKPSAGAATAGDVTLDFADADVRDVSRTIFGEILKQPYTIDPKVSGRITLKTGQPIAQSAVVTALEVALKIIGAAIVPTDGIYNIIPIGDAKRQGSQLAYNEDPPGYSIEIISLRYINAGEMQRVLEPLAPQGGIVRVDTQRNLIFLAGTEPERAGMRDTIAMFDADYLKGMSFALIQPAHVEAGTLAEELAKIFDSETSPIAGLVRIIPISRINSLLVVTSRATYLHQVGQWVTRLDVQPAMSGRQLYYYRVQNARAADVARTLGTLFRQAVVGAAPTSSQQPQSFAPALTAGSSVRGLNPVSYGSTQIPPPPPASLNTGGQNGTGSSGDGPEIVTDEANNALIIRADAGEYGSIEKIIRAMDVVPDQVLVEATIVEVTLNDQLQYGVDWYLKSGKQIFEQTQTGKVAALFPGFSFTYLVPNVQVALNALGSVTNVTVLSSPKLLTLDNKTASLEVGDEVPIITRTAISNTDPDAPIVASVEQRNTGVLLSVTPRIGNSGMVFLEISQEVSDVIPTTTSKIDSPTIQERRIQGSVAIKDGDTVALGGLIRQSHSKGNSGIPFLKDIPILGHLARTDTNNHDRTELLVFLTPRIVRTPKAARAMTDDIISNLGEVRRALGEFGRENGAPLEQ